MTVYSPWGGCKDTVLRKDFSVTGFICPLLTCDSSLFLGSVKTVTAMTYKGQKCHRWKAGIHFTLLSSAGFMHLSGTRCECAGCHGGFLWIKLSHHSEKEDNLKPHLHHSVSSVHGLPLSNVYTDQKVSIYSSLFVFTRSISKSKIESCKSFSMNPWAQQMIIGPREVNENRPVWIL